MAQDKDPLELWATKVEEYNKRTPEEQQVDRDTFFEKFILPRVGDENLEQAHKTFELATMPTKNLPKTEAFLQLDEPTRKGLLADNLRANGTKLTKSVRGKTIGEQVGDLTSGHLPGGAHEYIPEVEQAYEAFKNSPDYNVQALEAHAMSVGQPVRKVQRLVSSLAGETAQTNKLNDQMKATEKLQGQVPSSAGTELAADVGMLAAPSTAISRATQVAEKAGIGSRLFNWGLNAVGQGTSAAPVSTSSVAGGEDVNRQVAAATGKSAIVGTATAGVLSGLLSPTTVDMGRKAARYISPVADLGDDVAGRVAAANPKMNQKQILGELQGAQQRLFTSSATAAPEFQGMKANAQLADMQASVPKTDYNQIQFDAFEQPILPATGSVAALADTSGIPATATYLKTQVLPQSRNDFNVAKKASVQQLEDQGKQFVNTLYNDARATGVLSTPLGISQNQLAAQTRDLLSDPQMQKLGLEKLPSVQDLLRGTSGPAQLTADDAMRLQIGLANDFKASKAEGIKPLIDMVSNTLDGSQNAGIKQLRQQVADYQTMLDDSIGLTKEQFNATAGMERTFATRPIMKALANGADGASIAKAAVSKAPQGQLTEILQDKTLHATTKAAVAADMMDTLAIQDLKAKGSKINLQAFASKYGDDEVAARVKEIFAADKDFLKDFETIRTAANNASALKTATGVVAAETGGNAFKQTLSGAGAQATGTRTQLSSGVTEFVANSFNKKTRQFLRDSITDKSKSLKILDSAIGYQKGKVQYTELFDKYIRPGIGRSTVTTEEMLDSKKTGEKFVPMNLNGDTKTVVEPLSNSYTSPFEVPEVKEGLKQRSPFDVLDEKKPQKDLTKAAKSDIISPDMNVKKAVQNTVAAGLLASAPATASKVNPVDPKAQYAAQVIGVESSFGKDKSAFDDKGAQGYAQFFGAAKADVEKRLGRPINPKSLEDSIAATAAYAEINKEYLQKMGIENPSKGDLYAAHVLGAGGFAKLKKQGDAKVSAGQFVSKEAFKDPVNKSFFFDDKGRARTPSQVLQILRNRYSSKSKKATEFLMSANHGRATHPHADIEFSYDDEGNRID